MVREATFSKGDATNRVPIFRAICSRLVTNLFGSLVVWLIATAVPLVAAVLPAGFTETQVGSNLSGSPTAMDFAPDGRLFVCLQSGQLRVIENGILLSVPFVTVPTLANGERGLLGIAFDPDFASNQFVYVYYTAITSPIHNRVSRFTAKGNVAVAGSETIILELDDLSGATNHNGGAIHFGPDGKLYVGVGENANASNAQVLSNRLGKLLRINADGSIPSDNPTTFPGIAGSPEGDNRAIWVVGLRNPYTFAFQPGSGRLFINDVGQSAFEEINDGIVGSNYGWPNCEGSCSPPNPDYRDPLHQYGHGGDGGCAIVGGAFYNPAVKQFPASYVGKYFFADLCSGWIRLFDPSNNTASSFATDISIPIDLKVGPEGSLYYLNQGNGGQVWKVSSTTTPSPTPTATPVASATPTPAHPVNLSTRMRVDIGNGVGIGGFIVTGGPSTGSGFRARRDDSAPTGSPKHLLLRAIGPSLTNFGIPNALADPIMELHGPNGFVTIVNDNWQDDPKQAAVILATGIAPTNDLESAIDVTLTPGAYTAVVRGNNSGSGVALIEVYDLDQAAPSKLANLSTRAVTGTGSDVVIAGIVLGANSGDDRVAIRGIGPSLVEFGITNALVDPTLELHGSNGTLLAANDNWGDDPTQAKDLAMAGLALANPLESGVALALPPGLYTAILAGLNGGVGIGLVEVYDRESQGQ